MKNTSINKKGSVSIGLGIATRLMLVVLLATTASCGSSGENESVSDAGLDYDDNDMARSNENSEIGSDSDSDSYTDDDSVVDESLPAIAWRVDSTIKPFTPSLHPMSIGESERPLSAVGGEGIPTASFVQNELVLFSDDAAEVAAFVDRVSGKLVLTVDPGEAGVEGPLMHLVVVEVPSGGMEDFEGNLKALFIGDRADLDDSQVEEEGEENEDTVTFLFSDQQGAKLMALAAREAKNNGLSIGVNWVGEPVAIPSSTEEETDGAGGHHNAYNFSWFAQTSGMRTGVTEAWNLLHSGGKIGNQVKIAILDMGFKSTSDLEEITASTVWPGFGPMNKQNDYNCTNGTPCPWHGTDVAGAAMAIPDNRFGSAGSGGPVGSPIMIYTTYDYLASITAVYRARNLGAKIINMSYGTPVPWIFAWTTLGFRHATDTIRDSGVLLFAAAGNNGRNVDSKTCFLGHCWEKTYYTPCENPGVTCVGGLNDSETKATDSNYGTGSVDLYGPWCLSVGPNPDVSTFHNVCGTSVASPFVAGVAALVWAGRPSASASDVAHFLAETADGYRDEKVNAYQAVLSAVGTLGNLAITQPTPGSEFVLGIPTPLVAKITFVSLPGSPVDVELTWSSSADGELGTQTVTVERNSGDVHSETVYFDHPLSEGYHEISLRAEYNLLPDWIPLSPTRILEAESSVLVSNPAPTVSITSPSEGDTFCQGQTIVLSATGEDTNQTLDDDDYSWLSLQDDHPFNHIYMLGTGRVISTDALPMGEQTIRVTLTDDEGKYATESVIIEVIPNTDPLCTNLPPQISIASPSDGDFIMPTGSDENGPYVDVDLRATVSDYEDDDSTLTVEWYSDLQGHIATGQETSARLILYTPCGTVHVITGKVIDSDGNETEDEIHIHSSIVC